LHHVPLRRRTSLFSPRALRVLAACATFAIRAWFRRDATHSTKGIAHMPTKHLAITIAGAVSLGSYEAGATYEILDAIRQHNDDPETVKGGDFINIDVLTGASAGGMTAAILAQKLLFAKNEFVDASGKSSPYNNPLYNTWVLGIGIDALLNTVDKPVPQGDPATLSLLSSNLIEAIARKTLAQPDDTGNIPLNGGAHNAIDPARGVRLGLALTNINGNNYSVGLFGGGKFLYTNFSDQMLRFFSIKDTAIDPWREISQAAVACGAFPFAFRSKDLQRARVDYEPAPTLEPWPGGAQSYTFTYTDGGVLQNQPLGMAKNLVDCNDNHLGNDNRFYLFVSPSPMEGKQDLNLHADTTTLAHVGGRLIDVYMAQAEFRDWIQVAELNEQIDLLNARARGLASALKAGQINAADLVKTSDALLKLLYSADTAGETQQDAEARLQKQYSGPDNYLAGLDATQTAAFLKAVLTLEKAANLGDHDEMQVYGIVTQAAKLAGAGICAFVGFLDQSFRDHDYDWGRTVAQNLLANPLFQAAGQLGPIRYTPAPIRRINTALDGLHLNQIPRSVVADLKSRLKHRANQIVTDTFTNAIERYPAQWGIDLALGVLIDWEFSRDKQ
jgi:predicted acylesterase/phospholipase RssA